MNITFSQFCYAVITSNTENQLKLNFLTNYIFEAGVYLPSTIHELPLYVTKGQKLQNFTINVSAEYPYYLPLNKLIIDINGILKSASELAHQKYNGFFNDNYELVITDKVTSLPKPLDTIRLVNNKIITLGFEFSFYYNLETLQLIFGDINYANQSKSNI